jgi:nucleoside permease NupC
MAVIGFSREGIDMVFGPLADTEVIGFSFAINVLPIIIFFSALMSVLYHLRVMEWIVKLVGGFLHKVIGTGAVESMNAAANIFVGQTEAPLAVRPYLKGLTEPQMFAVMVSGLASIAGTVLAGYAMMGAELKYLLAAAFMAAPQDCDARRRSRGVGSARKTRHGEEPAQERHSCCGIGHDGWLAPGSEHRGHVDCVRGVDRVV